MFGRYVISFGVLFATLAGVSSASYAFEKTPGSSDNRPSLQIIDSEATGWDQAVENSLILSNPFADTSEVAPTPHTYFKAAIDTNALAPAGSSQWQPGRNYQDTGTLGVAETGYRRIGKDQFGVGSWQYTAHPDAFTPPDQKPSKGVYVSAERTLYNEDSKTVVGFASAGHLPGDVVQSRNGWGMGFAMKGFVKDRPDGQFLFGVTGGTNSAIAESTGAHPLETRFELTYQDKIADNISIQPGLNFTINPSSDPAETRGLVAGMRIHVTFK